MPAFIDRLPWLGPNQHPKYPLFPDQKPYHFLHLSQPIGKVMATRGLQEPGTVIFRFKQGQQGFDIPFGVMGAGGDEEVQVLSTTERYLGIQTFTGVGDRR